MKNGFVDFMGNQENWPKKAKLKSSDLLNFSAGIIYSFWLLSCKIFCSYKLLFLRNTPLPFLTFSLKDGGKYSI